MNKKFGFNLVEVLVVIGMIIVICAVCVGGICGCRNKYAFDDKQYFDFHHNFKYAYVTEGTNVVKYSIKAWKENSSAIQVITTDGKAIYTHLNRVLLTDK